MPHPHDGGGFGFGRRTGGAPLLGRFRRGKTGQLGFQLAEGPDFLRSLLERYIVPQAEMRTQRTAGLFEGFRREFEAPPGSLLLPQLQRATTAFAQDIYRPGGAVQQSMQEALGLSVKSGFGPTSGGFAAQRANIGREAERAVANFMAQQAVPLAAAETERIGTKGRFLQGQEELASDFLTSIFTGAASAEQLELALRALLAQLS